MIPKNKLYVIGTSVLGLFAPLAAFAYDFESQAATSTNFAVSIVTALFNVFLNLLGQVLPYAIGIFLVYVGIHWGRRALSGR